MKDVNEIHCADCGKFILTEEKESACGNIKCVAGSYANWMYDLFGHGICYAVLSDGRNREHRCFSKERWYKNREFHI